MQGALARNDYVTARQARIQEEERRHRQGRRESLEKKHQLQLTRRGYIGLFLALVLMFSLLFMVVWLNIAATQKGYSLKSLERGIAEEKVRQEELRLEVARLESPARIEKIATEQLGMVLPVQSELVRLPAPGREPATAGGGQGAGSSLGNAIAPNQGSGTQ